jgi:hypothetical protein
MKSFEPTSTPTTPTTSIISMTNAIINNISTFVNQECFEGISLTVPTVPTVPQTVREAIGVSLVCAATIVLLLYMALDTYRTYQRLRKHQSNKQRRQPPPPVSILRPPRKDWGSPKPKTSSNRVRFAGTFRRRHYVQDQDDLQSKRERIREIYCRLSYNYLAQHFENEVLPELQSVVRESPLEDVSNGEIAAAPTEQSDNAATDTPQPSSEPPRRRSLLCKLKIKDAKAKRKQEELALKNHQQMLPTVLHDMLSNNPVPMDLDEDEPNMEEEAPPTLKRTTAYCLVSSRPTKRRKLKTSTVPTSAAEWAKRTNERCTPLLPVIIEEGPEEEQEEDDESHIDSSLDAGFALKNHPQMLPTVLHDMLSNNPVPMDLDEDEPNMEDEAPPSLKRTAAYCLVSFRPTKRRKLKTSTVPTSASEWAKRTNERCTPLLPVIIEEGPEEEEEEDDESHIDSSLDAGFNNDKNINSDGPNFALVETPLEDISDDEIAAPPPEQSENTTTDIPSDGMGSGWTESGKRYSRRLRGKLFPDEEDPSTEALGSGMTEKGRRFSRRVANQGSDAN